MKPTISYVITHKEEDDIVELVNLCQSNSVDNVTFQYVKPIVEMNSEPVMDMFDMGQHVCRLFDIMEKPGLRWSVEISFPLCLIPDEYRNLILQSGKAYVGCHIRRCSGVIFDTDFKIIPCNHFVNMPYSDNALHPISSQSIETLWKSEDYTGFINTIGNYPGSNCKKCSMWNQCGGGCFTRWLFNNPEQYCIGIKQ